MSKTKPSHPGMLGESGLALFEREADVPVDQQLGEGAGLGVPPVAADRIRPIEVREHHWPFALIHRPEPMDEASGLSFRMQMSRVTVRIGVPLVAALVLTSTAACDWTGTPSAQECVDDWNARAGRLARERVVAGQLGSAMARGWLAKETYPGCGIIFRGARGLPTLDVAAHPGAGAGSEANERVDDPRHAAKLLGSLVEGWWTRSNGGRPVR